MRQKYINHAEFSDVLMVRSHAFKRPGLWLKPFFGLPPRSWPRRRGILGTSVYQDGLESGRDIQQESGP
jgi:hypothetical protein